jgi:hypothetical protein
MAGSATVATEFVDSGFLPLPVLPITVFVLAEAGLLGPSTFARTGGLESL